MASTISAGTTAGTAIAISGDTSGNLVLQTNGTTTAVTISTGQVVTLAQPLPVASGGSGVITSTGTGSVVLGTSPTLTTPTISSLSSASATALTLQSAGTTAITVDTSQNVGIGTSSPSTYGKLAVSDGTVVFAVSPYSAGNTLYTGVITNHAYAFLQNNLERMRIDTGGNLLVGMTDAGNTLRYFDVQNTNTGASAGAIARLITSNVAGSGTVSVDIVKYKSGGLVINNNETNAAAFTAFGVGSSERMRIDSSGGLILAGSTAQKATGTTWSNPSDKRIKDNIRDYTKGTTELMQVRVREWEYNGKGGTTEGITGLGVIADEVMTVLPNTVDNYVAKLNVDDEETTDIKKFDATEITWLLVKTVQELKAIIDTQAERITALEVK